MPNMYITLSNKHQTLSRNVAYPTSSSTVKSYLTDNIKQRDQR